MAEVVIIIIVGTAVAVVAAVAADDHRHGDIGEGSPPCLRQGPGRRVLHVANGLPHSVDGVP